MATAKQKRISQEMASNAANAMKHKFFDEKIKSAADKAAASIERIIDRYVPSDMRQAMDVYEKQFGNAITNTPSLSAANVTFRYLPFKLHKKYQPQITLEDEDLRRVQDFIDDFRKVQDEAREYGEGVARALYDDLRYPSRVKAEFPEAYEFLDCDEAKFDNQRKATIAELRKAMQ